MIGLGYESIHACVNDCFLFRGDNNKDVHFCSVCKTSRWKDSNTPGKKVPKKVLRYFLIILRLQRLYKSSHTAKEMTWHATGKCTKPGLAVDGFNLFDNLSQAYSMWPVILTAYNLPPWLCMKESSFMLMLLSPGPKSPGKDIDVYLKPLIDDLKQYFPDEVTKPIIELYSFFKQICFENLMEDDMLKAQSKVVDILCNLELIYPPAFFDIMIHLVIHLPLEALEGRPIGPRWMFPFERFMKKLKGYVRNKAKPEGSIAEGYVTEEALTFSSHYFQDVTMKFNHPGHNILQRHVDNDPGVSTTNELFALSYGPTPTLISINSCVVNDVRFVMHSRDERHTTQNSDICSPGGKDGEINEGRKVKHLVLRNNLTQILTKGEAFKDDQYILATQAKQCFYLEDMARRQPHWKVVKHVNHKKFSDGGVIMVEEDPDVIHFDNSSDLPLFTSLNELDNATLHIDGQSTEVNTPPDIIDLDEDGDIIDDEDALPHDLADSDDEDLINVDDDDGVDETRNLGLKKIIDDKGPVPIRFEWDDKKTLMSLGDHASHWSNYLGELIREMPLYYPSWQKVLVERKARVLTKIGHLQKLYNTNKASLKAAHWVINPKTETYDVESIRKRRPQNIILADWDAQIAFWNDPRNQARAAQNRQNQAKSTVVCRQGSRSLARLRDQMMESSTTRDYPSLIHTFFVTYTVNRVFTRDEDRAIYEEMLRLWALGSNTPSGVPYTEEEINALARKGKQRGHLPGVGRVLPGRATYVLIPPPSQCTHNSDDVEKLKKKNNISQHLSSVMPAGVAGEGTMRWPTMRTAARMRRTRRMAIVRDVMHGADAIPHVADEKFMGMEWKAIVGRKIRWSVLGIAILAVVVGSQAIITGTFSIIRQCSALGAHQEVPLSFMNNVDTSSMSNRRLHVDDIAGSHDNSLPMEQTCSVYTSVKFHIALSPTISSATCVWRHVSPTFTNSADAPSRGSRCSQVSFHLSFNLKSGEFGEVCLPAGKKRFCDVWIMKEGASKSFTKMLSIKAPDRWGIWKLYVGKDTTTDEDSAS
nr:hypothetical protein [Tanacetum cinerariifolium]